MDSEGGWVAVAGRKRSELEFGFGSLGVCNFAPSLLVRDLESLSFLNGF